MKKQFFFTMFFSNNSGILFTLLASIPQADTQIQGFIVLSTPCVKARFGTSG